MSRFADNEGREFEIVITLGKLRTIRERFPLDIFNFQDWTRLTESLADRLALVWYLVEQQATERDLDSDAFEMSLQGSGIADACSEALLEAIENFYRSYGQEALAILTKARRETLTAVANGTSTPEYLDAMRKAQALERDKLEKMLLPNGQQLSS